MDIIPIHTSVLFDESILLLVIGIRFDGQWCKILLVVAMVSSLQIEAVDEDMLTNPYLFNNTTIYTLYTRL